MFTKAVVSPLVIFLYCSPDWPSYKPNVLEMDSAGKSGQRQREAERIG